MNKVEEIVAQIGDLLKSVLPKAEVARIEKATNELERKALFVVLAPEEVDAHGDIYSSEEIEKAMQDFNKHCMVANLFHRVETKEAEISQSYTTPVDMYIGDRFIKKGTWLQEWYFPETEMGETLWQGVLSGEIVGLSVGCKAMVENLSDE